MGSEPATLVLTHGAGDTAQVWRRVQGQLTIPSYAQRRLAVAINAGDLRTVESDHNVARSAPTQLAALLREIVANVDTGSSRFG